MFVRNTMMLCAPNNVSQVKTARCAGRVALPQHTTHATSMERQDSLENEAEKHQKQKNSTQLWQPLGLQGTTPGTPKSDHAADRYSEEGHKNSCRFQQQPRHGPHNHDPQHQLRSEKQRPSHRALARGAVIDVHPS